LGTAQTWSNTDTTGGLVDVETPVIINGLWNMASGYIRLGKAASDSGSGGVEITGANVTLSSPSGTPANAAFGTGTVVFTTGSLSYVSASSGAATFANTFNINGGFTFGGNGGSGVNMTFSGTGTISGSPTVTFSDTSGNPGTTFSNTVTLDSNATFTGAGNSTFSGGIADDGGTRSLSYTGTGRLTLSAASTYTGGTSISGGKVFANSTTGSSTGTGSISITGGTLLGTGSIAPSAGNNINIGASGTLFPGTGANSTGGLTLTNASTTQNLLTAAPNATLSFDLNTGVASSKLTLAGSVGIGTGANAELAFNSGGTGSTNTLISITDLSGGTLSGGAYDLIVGSSNGQYSGLTFGGTATDGGSIITGGLALASNSFTSTYASSFLELNNGVLEVDVASVPEPSTWCLLLAGLGIFWLVPALRRTSGVLISD
jgi:autotransporter-associated beta strand protein